MQISRGTDYAIRCVLFLAGRPGRISMVEEIASGMNIPRSFLAKILQKLTRAGIVESFRGIRGGFRLGKQSEQISLFDIIDAMQDSLALSMCAVDKKACSLSCSCAVHPVWIELRKTIEERLRSVNFGTESLLKPPETAGIRNSD